MTQPSSSLNKNKKMYDEDDNICAACNGTGNSYWSDDCYGTCLECCCINCGKFGNGCKCCNYCDLCDSYYDNDEKHNCYSCKKCKKYEKYEEDLKDHCQPCKNCDKYEVHCKYSNFNICLYCTVRCTV